MSHTDLNERLHNRVLIEQNETSSIINQLTAIFLRLFMGFYRLSS